MHINDDHEVDLKTSHVEMLALEYIESDEGGMEQDYLDMKHVNLGARL